MENNRLTDLNDHLFAQMKRLGDEDLKGDELKAEIERSRAVAGIASQIVQNASLALQAKRFQVENGIITMPKMLGESTNAKR